MLILRGPNEPISALAFSPDATKLYATHEGFAVGNQIWNLAGHTNTRFGIKGDIAGKSDREGGPRVPRCPTRRGRVWDLDL